MCNRFKGIKIKKKKTNKQTNKQNKTKQNKKAPVINGTRLLCFFYNTQIYQTGGHHKIISLI